MPAPDSNVNTLTAAIVAENSAADPVKVRECVTLFVRDRDAARKEGDPVKGFDADLKAAKARWADASAPSAP